MPVTRRVVLAALAFVATAACASVEASTQPIVGDSSVCLNQCNTEYAMCTTEGWGTDCQQRREACVGACYGPGVAATVATPDHRTEVGTCAGAAKSCHMACASPECDAGCNFDYAKCVNQASVSLSVESPHPIRPSECVAACFTQLQRCRDFIQGWCNPAAPGASCRTQMEQGCQMGLGTCQATCQRMPPGPSGVKAAVASVAPVSAIVGEDACGTSLGYCMGRCAGAGSCNKSCMDMYNRCTESPSGGQPDDNGPDPNDPDFRPNNPAPPEGFDPNDPGYDPPQVALAATVGEAQSPCHAACVNNLVQCTGPRVECNSAYWTCESGCSSASVESSTPVTGVRECVKECAAKGKEAASKCKHEKFNKRAACYAQVPSTVKSCEAGCARKPHGLEEARPLLGDCPPCDFTYDLCLPACNGMSNCQLKCMRDHFDCRMATPGC